MPLTAGEDWVISRRDILLQSLFLDTFANPSILFSLLLALLSTHSLATTKMKFTTSLASMVLAASSAFAAPTAVEPTPTLDKRATTISCDSWGSLVTGAYTIYHNNWGASAASSGSQCTYFDSLSGSTVAWHTTWSWAGGSSSVKSYSNVALENVNKQLSAVSSIPSVWKYT